MLGILSLFCSLLTMLPSGVTHLLPGVDPLPEHDRAVGAVPQGLESDVPIHGPHVATAGH